MKCISWKLSIRGRKQQWKSRVGSFRKWAILIANPWRHQDADPEYILILTWSEASLSHCHCQWNTFLCGSGHTRWTSANPCFKNIWVFFDSIINGSYSSWPLEWDCWNPLVFFFLTPERRARQGWRRQKRFKSGMCG